MIWKTVKGNTSVIETKGSLIPLYHLSDQEIILVDGGEEAHPELLEDLKRQRLRVRAVLTTHLHPDHTANNDLFYREFGSEIFVSIKELETLHSFAKLSAETDPPELRNAMQGKYPLSKIYNEPFLDINGAQFEVISTPGHSCGHLSFVTPDGVCCLGDAMISRNVLTLTKMPFMFRVEQALRTMENLRNTQYPLYIVTHRGVVPHVELNELIDLNIEKELVLYQLLRSLIPGPIELEELITTYLQASGISREHFIQDRILRYSAKSRLRDLVDAGEYYIQNRVVFPKLHAFDQLVKDT